MITRTEAQSILSTFPTLPIKHYTSPIWDSFGDSGFFNEVIRICGAAGVSGNNLQTADQIQLVLNSGVPIGLHLNALSGAQYPPGHPDLMSDYLEAEENLQRVKTILPVAPEVIFLETVAWEYPTPLLREAYDELISIAKSVFPSSKVTFYKIGSYTPDSNGEWQQDRRFTNKENVDYFSPEAYWQSSLAYREQINHCATLAGNKKLIPWLTLGCGWEINTNKLSGLWKFRVDNLYQPGDLYFAGSRWNKNYYRSRPHQFGAYDRIESVMVYRVHTEAFPASFLTYCAGANEYDLTQWLDVNGDLVA